MIRNLIIIVSLLISSMNLSAQDVADYKYIIVPAKFEFQDTKNEYQLNAFSRFLFKKYGFDAYLETEDLPADLNTSGCNSLYMEPKAEGFLSTKITFDLVNCRNEVVYTSPRGTSKIKQYREAYQDALRRAFEGFEELGYEYSDKVIKDAVVTAVVIAEEESDSDDLVETKEKERVTVAAEPMQSETVKDTTLVVQAYTKDATPQKAEAPFKEIKNTGEVRALATAIVKTGPQTEKQNRDLVSTDGSYLMKPAEGGFDVYEGETKIGSAIKTSGGSYLVNTSQFTGVGYYDQGEFTVEREIKGVEGLVKMTFKKAE